MLQGFGPASRIRGNTFFVNRLKRVAGLRMANDDHNEILRRGVNFWNDWRRKLSIIPDFSGEHMTEFLHLENANFYRANFKGATFYHNDLSRDTERGRS